MKLLVLNGPNLNLLGLREPDIYGTDSIKDIEIWLNSQIESDGYEVIWFQSNHEGDLIDQIHASINEFDGLIINPGSLTHYSYALRDAISSISNPVIEVHISDINQREDFRKKSVIKNVCIGQISGKGKAGYFEALKALINHIRNS